MWTSIATCLLPVLPLAAAHQTWTVDDDGPADFASVAAAVDSPSVVSGDTLLVAPGSYPGKVRLGKALHLLPSGSERYSLGDLEIADVKYFTLIGAELTGLSVKRVPGLGLIDDCKVYELDFGGGYELHRDSFTDLDTCGDLVIQRSSFYGRDSCYPGGPDDPGPGMTITRSLAAITDCWIEGGNNGGWLDCNPHYPGLGFGVIIADNCDVMLAGTTVSAGWTSSGGWYNAEALRVLDSRVQVRGNAEDYLSSYNTLSAVYLDQYSHVSVSGVDLSPGLLPAGVASPDPPEPFLTLTGGSRPGEALQFELFGPKDSPALLAIAKGMPPKALPFARELLWLDPAGVLLIQPLVTRSQRMPARFSLRIPPIASLFGERFAVQAWVDRCGPSGPRLTNPLAITIH